MSLRAEITYIKSNEARAAFLSIDNIRATAYSNGDMALHFECEEYLNQASEETGWLPIRRLGGDYDGFMFIPTVFHNNLRELLADIDAFKERFVFCSEYRITSQDTDQNMRLRLFNDRSNPLLYATEIEDMMIENITMLKFADMHFYLYFDDESAYQKAVAQTGWKTIIDMDMILKVPQKQVWDSPDCYIPIAPSDHKVTGTPFSTPEEDVWFNHFELMSQ